MRVNKYIINKVVIRNNMQLSNKLIYISIKKRKKINKLNFEKFATKIYKIL